MATSWPRIGLDAHDGAEEAIGQHGRGRDGDARHGKGDASDGHKDGGLGQTLYSDLETSDLHRHEGPAGHTEGERDVAALDARAQARALEEEVRIPPPDDEPLHRLAADEDRRHEPAAEPVEPSGEQEHQADRERAEGDLAEEPASETTVHPLRLGDSSTQHQCWVARYRLPVGATPGGRLGAAPAPLPLGAEHVREQLRP